MITKIQKWGNSQGLRFPKALLYQAELSIGDEVDMEIYHGEIVIKPAVRIRGKYNLKNLVAEIPSHYKAKEENWGSPVGKEIW